MIYHDVIIIGAGIVGLTVSHQIKKKHPSISILVVEKESQPGYHSSGRNSGVLHAGIYYPEKSIKAKVCVKGAKRLKTWVEINGLNINKCGKIIVAQNKDVESQIDLLASRAESNGVEFSLIGAESIRKKVPGISRKIRLGIWSPNTCVVNPKEVMRALSEQLKGNDVIIKTNTKTVKFRN